jgi:hypothetical protein
MVSTGLSKQFMFHRLFISIRYLYTFSDTPISNDAEILLDWVMINIAYFIWQSPNFIAPPNIRYRHDISN